MMQSTLAMKNLIYNPLGQTDHYLEEKKLKFSQFWNQYYFKIDEVGA